MRRARRGGRFRLRFWWSALAVAVAPVFLWGSAGPAAYAASYFPISGEGSEWAQNAVSQWVSDVSQLGMRVAYAGEGSWVGRHDLLAGTADFAVSDLAFQASEAAPANTYALLPITAGGLGFMYNLEIKGQRVTNLRLSGENLAEIFTGVITNWDDPALASDNPGLQLPDLPITPVVQTDPGPPSPLQNSYQSGATEQFTAWMSDQYPQIWAAYCQKAGLGSSCGPTITYPATSGMVAPGTGDLGISSYVSQPTSQGAIGYVNYAYTLPTEFPVVQVLNAAGYYTAPDPENVALSLLSAQIDTTDTDPSLYLTQQLHNVYTDPDPRAYPLSYYAYMIVPTRIVGQFSTVKGKTLAAFAYYAVCQGQNDPTFGHAPLPVNLVQAAFQQIQNIPGATPSSITLQGCNNPTFDSGGNDLLTAQVPMPPACDQHGPSQCATEPAPQLPEGRPWLMLLSGLSFVAGIAAIRSRAERRRPRPQST